MKESFQQYLKISTNYNDIPMFLIMVVVNLLILAGIYFIVIEPILYKKKYSSMKYDIGIVTDRDNYATTSTHYVKTGKHSSVPVTTTTQHYDITIEGEIFNRTMDNFTYYKMLRIGDKVKITYVKMYKTFRFSAIDNWKFISNDIKNIEKKEH